MRDLDSVYDPQQPSPWPGGEYVFTDTTRAGTTGGPVLAAPQLPSS